MHGWRMLGGAGEDDNRTRTMCAPINVDSEFDWSMGVTDELNSGRVPRNKVTFYVLNQPSTLMTTIIILNNNPVSLSRRFTSCIIMDERPDSPHQLTVRSLGKSVISPFHVYLSADVRWHKLRSMSCATNSSWGTDPGRPALMYASLVTVNR